MRTFLVSIVVAPGLGECGVETKHILGVVEADNMGEARSKLDVETREYRFQRGRLAARNPRVEIIPLRKIDATDLDLMTSGFN